MLFKIEVVLMYELEDVVNVLVMFEIFEKEVLSLSGDYYYKLYFSVDK